MIDYRAGTWGFHVALGCSGSLVPKALAMAIPNAIITFFLATIWQMPGIEDADLGQIADFHDDRAKAIQIVIGAFTTIMTFILYRRSSVAYDRWWEGGTLLQKSRGEWFNAYSSIMAFTSTKPEMQAQVDSYVQLLTRLMSLLMCCGLQQVSPNRDRGFEIFDLNGIEPESMEFLNSAPDKVEIILQWIQRSMVLHMQTGVLPIAPPILSRAFQEVSRGIVNLQNARKIADFPYPYPLAQISMILQIIHYAMIPPASALAMPRMWAVLFSFATIFVLWCIHFNAIELEFPFGSKSNDLPMVEFQQDWNKSIATLADRRATRPPSFACDSQKHQHLTIAMSDASDLYKPRVAVLNRGCATIKIAPDILKKQSGCSSSMCPGSPLTKAGIIGVLRKYKLLGWESPDSVESPGNPARMSTRLGFSIQPTTELGISSGNDNGQELVSPLKAVPEPMADPVKPSSTTELGMSSRNDNGQELASPAPGSSPAPRMTPLVQRLSMCSSGSSPAPAVISRASSALPKATPSKPPQQDAAATAVAAEVSPPGQSSASCFSGTATPLRADLAGIRLEGLGCFGGTFRSAGITPPA